MLKFFVQLLLMLFLLLLNYKRKGKFFAPSSFLLGLYVLSALFAIPTVSLEGYKQPLHDYMWSPMFQFVVWLYAFLIPFTLFRETDIKIIRIPNRRLLDMFSSFVIIISLFSIIFFSSSVRMIFSLSSLGEARTALYGGEKYVEVGLANTIASVGASMYVFALLLFFIYSSIGNCKKRSMLLLISSISEPLHILSYVGRDGVVFWIFSFVFLYLFFKPFLMHKVRKKIKFFFLVCGMALILPFIAISVSRFGESDTGTDGSIISYMGQSFVNGMLYMNIGDKPYTEGAGFPLFYELTGIKQTIFREVGGGMIRIGEWRSWSFSTFVVSLYTNFSFWGLLLCSFICFLIQRIILGTKKRVFGFEFFFIYLLFFQIYSQGVFYFKQYTRGGNLFILLCFALYFIFKYSKKSDRTILKQV